MFIVYVPSFEVTAHRVKSRLQRVRLVCLGEPPKDVVLFTFCSHCSTVVRTSSVCNTWRYYFCFEMCLNVTEWCLRSIASIPILTRKSNLLNPVATVTLSPGLILPHSNPCPVPMWAGTDLILGKLVLYGGFTGNWICAGSRGHWQWIAIEKVWGGEKVWQWHLDSVKLIFTREECGWKQELKRKKIVKREFRGRFHWSFKGEYRGVLGQQIEE